MNKIKVFSARFASRAACTGFIAASSCFASLPALSQSVLHTNAPLHMPQGAFLRAPAPDVAHLVQQVKSDPAVAIRYSRLFHLPVKMVPLAFEQLHLKNLAVDHVMQVHFVRDGLAAKDISAKDKSTRDKSAKEDLLFKMRRVRAGTPVYCLPDGTPILVRVCGNPIRTRVSPEFYSSSAPVPNFNPREELLPRPTADSSTVFTAETPRRALLPAAPLPTIMPVPAADVLPVSLLPVAPALPPVALRAASLPPIYTWAHSPNGLFGLPALGLLSLLNTGRNGSIAPVVPTGIQSRVPTGLQPIVPSPSAPQTPDVPTVSAFTLPIPPVSPPMTTVPEPGILTLGIISLVSASYVCVRRRR